MAFAPGPVSVHLGVSGALSAPSGPQVPPGAPHTCDGTVLVFLGCLSAPGSF